MFVGILLLLIGLLMLLSRLDLIQGRFTDWLVPVALIALGANILVSHYRKKSVD